MDYSNLSVREFLENQSSLDLRDFYSRLFRRLKQLDKTFDIFVSLSKDQALAEVKAKPRRGGCLAGLPLSLKDNIIAKGKRNVPEFYHTLTPSTYSNILVSIKSEIMTNIIE